MTVSSVQEVQWQLLRERLREIYRQVQQQECATLPEGLPADRHVEMLLRLVGAMLALLEWHTIDRKGHCRVRRCASAWVPWWTRRTCPMFTTVHFWMEQPLRIVQKVGKKWCKAPGTSAT